MSEIIYIRADGVLIEKDPQERAAGKLYTGLANAADGTPRVVEMTADEQAARETEEAANMNAVPRAVTPLQARKALRAAGLLAAVETAVDAAGEEIREAWDYALEVRRNDPMLNAVAVDLEMSAADLDALFIAAAAL